MPWDLTPRPLLPPPPPPYRWWLPLPYLALLTFTLRWSSIVDVPDVIAAGAVAAGGWLLGLCTWRAGGSRYTPWVAGIVYCFCCSAVAVFGRNATTELLANGFVIAAWLVAVAPREYGVTYKRESLTLTRRHWAAAGLLLGVGSLLHPFVLVGLLGALSYIKKYYFRRSKETRRADWGRVAVTAVIFGALLLPVGMALAAWPVLDLSWHPLGEFHFGRWGQQLGWLGCYALYFVPLLLFGLTGFLRNILASGRTNFVPVLRTQSWWLVWLIVLFGGGRPEPLVLLHPLVALQFTESYTATGVPAYDAKHGFSLLLVLVAGLGIGYYYFSPL